MGTKIEQIIDDFVDYVETCKYVPFSKESIILNVDKLLDFVDQLRISTPEEIKRYQKIISNRDSIIKEAETKAANIISEAETRAETMVSENDIFQRACTRANEVVGDAQNRAEAMISEATNESSRLLYEANRDSEKIRTGALAYANDMLAEVENAIGNAYESIAVKSNMVVDTLKAHLDIVVSNRRELNGEAAPAQKISEDEFQKELYDDANEEFLIEEEEEYLANEVELATTEDGVYINNFDEYYENKKDE